MTLFHRLTATYQRMRISFPKLNPTKSLSNTSEDFIENIKKKLINALKPDFIEVINESAKHNVPKGSASHIRVTIVSSIFNEKRLVQRHRLVNNVLAEELKGPIHALSIDAVASSEVRGKIESKQSPPCRGGASL